jgi:hypothetical protein
MYGDLNKLVTEAERALILKLILDEILEMPESVSILKETPLQKESILDYLMRKGIIEDQITCLHSLAIK